MTYSFTDITALVIDITSFIIFCWVGIYAIALLLRLKSYKTNEFKLTFLQIFLPPENEIEIDSAEHMFAGLMGIRRPFWKALFFGQPFVSFEIVSKINGIGFYVVCPKDVANFVEKQINGAYPVAEIDLIDPTEIWDRGAFTSIAELKLETYPFFPLKTHKDIEKTDTLNILTSSMSKLSEHKVVALQIIMTPAPNNWINAGRRFVANVKAAGSSETKSKSGVDSSMTEGVEKKIGKSGFDVSIRIAAVAETKLESDLHVKNVVSAFETFRNVRYNKFKIRTTLSKKNLIHKMIYRKLRVICFFIPFFDLQLYRNTSVLNIEELATIFHYPNKNVQTPNIMWLTARKSAPPQKLPQEGLYLGKNVYRNTKTKIFMDKKDRTRHLYIVGQTGTGKSEFMKTLAIQDIKNGEGIAFIDPHGSDINDILAVIPPERIDDVILFDVSDIERPLGLNMLEAHTEEEKHMLINAFIALLYKLYDPNRQGIMGPILERAIRNTMLTAMVEPEATMVDVLRLLIDKKYIQKFLPKIQDPLVKKYWTDEVANTSEARKGEIMGYFVSKFDRFVTDRTMRNIVGQAKSAFNFYDIMAQKKILLVDLSKGKIGEENSNFLGLLLIPRILTAALARAALLGKEDFPDFFLYVDEFQNFATPDFATILSEARKYKLNLVVAHQFIAQLEDDIKEAVFGNVGSIVAFRVGPEDSEFLEKQFEPVFTKHDLINNPIGNAYVRLLVKGQPTTPFSLKVDWDMISATKKNPEIADEIRKRSREKYGVPSADVEKAVNERAGLNEKDDVSATALDKKKFIPF